jgi:hypothetical protein
MKHSKQKKGRLPSVAFHNLVCISMKTSRHEAGLVPARPSKGREQTGNHVFRCSDLPRNTHEFVDVPLDLGSGPVNERHPLVRNRDLAR